MIHPQEITKQYHASGQVKEKIDVEKVKTNQNIFSFFLNYLLKITLRHEMHRRGINMRLLGLVWQEMNDWNVQGKENEKKYWLEMIGLEIIIRAAKAVLAALMQRAMHSIKYSLSFFVKTWNPNYPILEKII